jgi:hypothetical protein
MLALLALRPLTAALDRLTTRPCPERNHGRSRTPPANRCAPASGGVRSSNRKVLYIAAKLGIADHLRGGDRSAIELARTLGVDAAALQRVLRVEAQNIQFAFRSDEGDRNRLPELAAELVRLNVDVIVARHRQELPPSRRRA